MSSPSEFDEYSDSIEHVSEDSSWDEASIALEVDENEETEILLSAVKLTRKVPLHRIRGGTEFRVGLEVVVQHSHFHKTITITQSEMIQLPSWQRLPNLIFLERPPYIGYLSFSHFVQPPSPLPHFLTASNFQPPTSIPHCSFCCLVSLTEWVIMPHTIYSFT